MGWIYENDFLKLYGNRRPRLGLVGPLAPRIPESWAKHISRGHMFGWFLNLMLQNIECTLSLSSVNGSMKKLLALPTVDCDMLQNSSELQGRFEFLTILRAQRRNRVIVVQIIQVLLVVRHFRKHGFCLVWYRSMQVWLNVEQKNHCKLITDWWTLAIYS